MRNRSVTIWLAVVLLVVTGSTRADFILTGNQELTVNTRHFNGTLHDTSSAFVVSGGIIDNKLWVHDYSTLNMFSGNINSLYAYEHSTVNISGGDMLGGNGPLNDLYANGNSTVNISGGSVGRFIAQESSNVSISGGSITNLQGLDFSVITLVGYDFVTNSEGLTLDGGHILGSGRLSGIWMDGTPWNIYIEGRDPTATILMIPEPATLLLLGLGAVVVRRKRK